MYTLVRSMPWGRLLLEQVPAITLSFVIAELFYKFHSFTLETLAFLATWGVIDAVIQVARYMVSGGKTTPANAPRR